MIRRLRSPQGARFRSERRARRRNFVLWAAAPQNKGSLVQGTNLWENVRGSDQRTVERRGKETEGRMKQAGNTFLLMLTTGSCRQW